MGPQGPQGPQPFKGFPSNYRPHVRPFYRFAATGLGASMWFFVCTHCFGCLRVPCIEFMNELGDG